MSQKKNESGKLVLLLIASVSIVVLIYCVVRLTLYTLSTGKSRNEIKDLKSKTESEQAVTPYLISDSGSIKTNDDEGVKELSVLSKYKPLYKDNSDFSGWVTIDGTKIDYPIMQTIDDEEFYLHKNFNKEKSDEGLPFIDARCDITLPSSNLIVYGHNMKNGDIFADLLKFSDKDYLDKHPFVKFDTIYETGIYKIISVFRVDVSGEDPNEFKFYEFVNDSESYPLSRYLSEIKSHSLFEIPFEEENVLSLITLVTCEYTKKDGRMVMIAAKMSDI